MYGYSEIQLKQTGIYRILNLINGKSYIGSASISFKKRWTQHVQLFANKNNQKYLQNAWNKYGINNFMFEIVEVVNGDIKNILEREQFYIDNTKEKYNISPTAGSPKGTKLSVGTKRKISESHLGIRPSDETKKKMSDSKRGSLNNRFGIEHSQETKKKMSRNAGNSCLGKFGKLHHNSKPVIQLDLDDHCIKKFECVNDIERELGFNRSNISKCCNGHLKKAYGFKWKFETVRDIY